MFSHTADLDFVNGGSDGGTGTQYIRFIEPGEQCVNISIVFDELLENSEVFHVVLSSRDDSVEILQRSAPINIMDSGSMCVYD